VLVSLWNEAQGVSYPGRPFFIHIYINIKQWGNEVRGYSSSLGKCWLPHKMHNSTDGNVFGILTSVSSNSLFGA
jgi:hypothetical protein